MSEWHRNEWFIKNHYGLRFTASAFLCPSPIRRRKLRSFGVTKMKRGRSFFSPNSLSSFPRLRLTSTRKAARPNCWRKYPRSSKVEQWSTLVKIDNSCKPIQQFLAKELSSFNAQELLPCRVATRASDGVGKYGRSYHLQVLQDKSKHPCVFQVEHLTSELVIPRMMKVMLSQRIPSL